MSKKYNFLAIVFLYVFLSAGLVLPVFASETDGTVDITHRYAWGENIGWIDFGSEKGNVHVFDSELTGYAWGENIGWISLNCSNTNSCDTVSYKVSNNSEGDLSGYAWGENVGWIDFSNVTIDTSGDLSGYAWGENIGWLSLNCSNTNSCDSVDYKLITDWRPQSVRKAVSVSSDEISKLLELKYIETEQDITATEKVVFKVETRTKVVTTEGEAEVVVPDQTEVVRSDGEKMDFTKLTVEDSSGKAGGVEDQDVVSAVQYGIPEVSLSFNKPVTISIPVDSFYNGKTLNVHTSKSATRDWEFLTTCDVLSNKCVFNTTAASYFAVTQRRGGGGLPSASYSLPITPPTGFSILINNGDEQTAGRRVTIEFNAGMDVKDMSITNYPDFNDAILENYAPLKEWNVCSETGGLIILPNCPEGAYTVYVKFYTQWGRESEAVSDSIVYKKIRLPEMIVEQEAPAEEAEGEEEVLSVEEIIAEVPAISAPEEPSTVTPSLPVIPQPPLVIPSEPSLPPLTLQSPPVITQPLSEIGPIETAEVVERPGEISPVEETVEELPIVVAPTGPPPVIPSLPVIPQPPLVIPREPPVSEESQTVIPPGEEEFVQEEIVTLYERATTSNVLVAAISNVRLMYGEITRSVLFTMLYVLLLSALLFVCGREVRRWHI
ncbi:hypothetical protein MYX06_02565 [Patescibacteria group bacterium AH-259-L05]|nr:hypothetical protein [Patescibacteria group bacterium AH-259-L05]